MLQHCCDNFQKILLLLLLFRLGSVSVSARFYTSSRCTGTPLHAVEKHCDGVGTLTSAHFRTCFSTLPSLFLSQRGHWRKETRKESTETA